MVPLVHEQSRETSFYDATATPTEDGGWVVCWWGRTSKESDEWFQQCLRVNTDPGGTITTPWCPGSAYERTQWAYFEQTAGDECDCFQTSATPIEWEPSADPFGQWVGVLGDCEGGQITLRVRPAFDGLFSIVWATEIWYAEELVWEQFTEWACGQFPFDQVVEILERGPCPNTTWMLHLHQDPH